MKQLFISASTAALVSTTLFLIQSGVWEDNAVDSRIEFLASVTAANTQSLSQLVTEISRLRDRWKLTSERSQTFIVGEETIDLKVLVERIEGLEATFEEIRSSHPAQKNEPEMGITDIYSKARRQYFESGHNPHDTLAEDEFQKDSGRTLGNHADSIEETLHAIPGIEVSEINCKSSICKVTYSQSESSDYDQEYGEPVEVVDVLAQRIDGQTVEVRYADDPLGNKIMYVQLK